MLTVSIFLIFIGFYFLYITSKRADYRSELGIYKWGHANAFQSKYIGILLIVLGLLLDIYLLGWGSGIFSFFVVLMTLASLIILISPIRFFSLKSIVVIGILALLLEINIL